LPDTEPFDGIVKAALYLYRSRCPVRGSLRSGIRSK
jgi:hypothetical protein